MSDGLKEEFVDKLIMLALNQCFQANSLYWLCVDYFLPINQIADDQKSTVVFIYILFLPCCFFSSLSHHLILYFVSHSLHSLFLTRILLNHQSNSSSSLRRLQV